MDETRVLKELLDRAADVNVAVPSTEALAHRRRDGRRATIGALAVALAVIAVVGLVAALPRHRPTASQAGPSPYATEAASPTYATSGPTTAKSLAAAGWTLLPPAPIAARSDAAAGWTGSEMIVWGGDSGAEGNQLYADGAAYDPSTRTWARLSASPLVARTQMASVWAGNVLFVWGGYGTGTTQLFDGAVYRPATDQWTPVPAIPATDYQSVQAVWTGRVVVLIAMPRDGKTLGIHVYDPATNAWTADRTLTLVHDHEALVVAALAVGDRVYLWNEWSHTVPLSANSSETSSGIDGYTLDAGTARWVSNDFAAGAQHTVVSGPLWTGSRILLPAAQLWCGACSHPPSLGTFGSLLDPATDVRQPMPHGPVDDQDGHALWTGSAFVAFQPESGEGAVWDPVADAWTPLAVAPLVSRGVSAVVWTGSRVLVWGVLVRPGTDDPQPTSGLQLDS